MHVTEFKLHSQTYYCGYDGSRTLPTTKPVDFESKTLQQDQIHRAIEILDKGLPCLKFTDSPFSYEYCHSKKTMLQTDLRNGDVFTMGTRPSSFSIVPKDSLGRHYLHQRWDYGDVCMNGERRRVEFEFHCCVQEHIAYVEEPSDCFYQVVIHTPLLCKEAFFQYSPKNEHQTLYKILCFQWKEGMMEQEESTIDRLLKTCDDCFRIEKDGSMHEEYLSSSSSEQTQLSVEEELDLEQQINQLQELEEELEEEPEEEQVDIVIEWIEV
jgi:hypothetical protein